MIAFLEGKLKIGLRYTVVQVILSLTNISYEPHTKVAEEIDLGKCNFCNFGSSLTLTVDRVIYGIPPCITVCNKSN